MSVLMRVHLIHDVAVDVETVEGIGIGTEGLKLGTELLTGKCLPANRHVLAEFWTRFHHLLCGSPNDLRLILFCGRRVHFGPWLVIGDKEDETHGRPLLRLAILPRDLDIRHAEAARTVRALPAEDRADD